MKDRGAVAFESLLPLSGNDNESTAEVAANFNDMTWPAHDCQIDSGLTLGAKDASTNVRLIDTFQFTFYNGLLLSSGPALLVPRALTQSSMRNTSMSGVGGAICTTFALVGAAVLCLVPLPSFAGESPDRIVVIANKSVAISKVTRDELRPIFQTKKDTWPDGTTAKPFNLPESNAARQGFDAAVLGLDPDRVARYWIDRKIRGGERPPQTAPSSAVMVKVIGKTAGAVGYVEATAVDASVKVIAKVVDGQVSAP